jgi:hypothetical protein
MGKNVQIHMFAFRWRPDATAADKKRAIAEIQAFSGQIPGLLEVHVGENTAANGGDFETGGVMKFASPEALQDYNTHPLHQSLLRWLLPLIDPLEVDFVSGS